MEADPRRRHNAARSTDLAWQHDHVVTRKGIVVPVRQTAQRPDWEDLPGPVRSLIEASAGSRVVGSRSAGTGFTPGFASRLDLADGCRLFVKAASDADDRANGWPLSDAYRDEARKLAALPSGIGAPQLVWQRDVELEGLRWIVLGFEYVDAIPPRRPWRPDQLSLVLDKLTTISTALTKVPATLGLDAVGAELGGNADLRLHQLRKLHGDTDWLRTVEELCQRGDEMLAGRSIVHLDLRDDNVLIDDAGQVWFVDWNWPAIGAPWIDLVCLLISAYGDGIDTDALLASHPLSRDVSPEAVDCLLALLWSFWAIGHRAEVPVRSPHLRNHQAWYADVTQSWLLARLSSRDRTRPGC
jgi:hypothetical protein